MKKQLPDQDIANELSGSSVFFTAQARSETAGDSAPSSETNAVNDQKAQATAAAVQSHTDERTPSSSHATVTPHQHDIKISNKHGQAGRRNQPTMTATTIDMTPETLEVVRKEVKQLGKEAATHRFTVEEKRAIADLVYTYQRQGYRTSENEITRIAVNWLLRDFTEHGEQSVLARMLELLHG